MSSKDVESRVLRFTVYEVDRHKRHVTVGHALFPIRDFDVNDGPATRIIWKDLERELSEVMYTEQTGAHFEAVMDYRIV